MKHFRDYLTEAKQTGVHLEGDLDAMNCKELESLGNLKTVEGFVYLDGCTALKSLPNGLVVGRDLNLTNCTALTKLPNGLEVGEDLHLLGCTALKSLPKDLIVQGFIYGASDELKEKYKDKYEFGQR